MANILLKGGTGSGKSNEILKIYKELIEEKSIPSEEILVLVMNRNQSLEWRKRAILNTSGRVYRTSFFGFVQEEIINYYPRLLKKCKEISQKNIKPTFLTLESSQYLLSLLIKQRREKKNAFFDLTAKDSKIAIDISSNLVKAATANIDYKEIGERLYEAQEIKTEEKRQIFETIDKIINDYRKRCLECGVMDFAMAIDLYNKYLLNDDEYIKSLTKRIKYILIDNLEEAVPIEIDLVEKLMSKIENMILSYNPECGYGSIFGANIEYVKSRILDKCEIREMGNKSYIVKPEVVEFSEMLYDNILESNSKKIELTVNVDKKKPFELRSDMLEEAIKCVDKLVNKDAYNPSDIALISTFADPVTEYVMTSGLEKKGIKVKNISRKARYIDNKFVHALVTLGYLCHPEEEIIPNRDDVKMLVMMILDIDPIRASILAGIICRQNPFAKFPSINEEPVIERIGYINLSKYERIRNFINEYRDGNRLPIDLFFQKVFIELLLVYNAKEDDIVQIKKLIDSATSFSETISKFGTIDSNKEFLKMIKGDIKSSESIFELEERMDEEAVTLSTPMTYLSNSMQSKIIIILGLSSDHWTPRCAKEISNPYVLTKTWNRGTIYSEEIEEENQRKNIAIIIRALLKRCSDKFITFESTYSGDGYENEGMLSEYF